MSELAATARIASENAATAVEENLDRTKRATQETLGAAEHAAERLGDNLQQGLHELGNSVRQASSHIPDFRQELRDDAAYVAERARYYHRNRPLDALKFVAAAAFVLGLFIGLGRR